MFYKKFLSYFIWFRIITNKEMKESTNLQNVRQKNSKTISIKYKYKLLLYIYIYIYITNIHLNIK